MNTFLRNIKLTTSLSKSVCAFLFFTILISLCISLITVTGGIKIGLLFPVILCVGILIFVTLFNQKVGIYLMLILGFFVFFIGKYINAPIGISMDLLLMIMLCGIIIQQGRDKNWNLPINMIMLWDEIKV